MPRKKAESITSMERLPPVATVEARENQVIALAYELAEKQLREGTASSQVIAHFLKMGSEKDRLERQILTEQAKLVQAKTKAIDNAEETKKLFQEAMDAMRIYQGNSGGSNDH